MVGGFDSFALMVMSSVELFPRPSSDSCSIPDLPQPRFAHSLSLLSGGRLVVCGGFASLYINTLDSCISWVAGNTSWTPLYNMRCLPIRSHFVKQNHSARRSSHMAWTPPSLPGSIVLLGGFSSPTWRTAEIVPGIKACF